MCYIDNIIFCMLYRGRRRRREVGIVLIENLFALTRKPASARVDIHYTHKPAGVTCTPADLTARPSGRHSTAASGQGQRRSFLAAYHKRDNDRSFLSIPTDHEGELFNAEARRVEPQRPHPLCQKCESPCSILRVIVVRRLHKGFQILANFFEEPHPAEEDDILADEVHRPNERRIEVRSRRGLSSHPSKTAQSAGEREAW